MTSRWTNHDDFRMALLPAQFEQLWDFPRNPIYRVLQAQLAVNRLARASLFHGPSGSAKTAVSYLLGAAVSCNNFHSTTHLGCGECETCRYVRLGTDSLRRGNFLEVDCGSPRTSGLGPITHLIEGIQDLTWRLWRKTGDEKYAPIIFIDEAQRLTPTEREALLKLIERSSEVHFVLVTTDLERLSIPGAEGGKNPLVSRCELFQFSYPTAEECVRGMTAAAQSVGLKLDPGVAERIAVKHSCCPRECLGSLHTLSSLGTRITLDMWQSFFEPQGSRSIPQTPAIDDILMQMS